MEVKLSLILYPMLTSLSLGVFISIALVNIAIDNKYREGVGTILAIAVATLVGSSGLVLKSLQYGKPERLLNILARPTSKFSMELIFTALCIILFIIFLLKRGRFKSGVYLYIASIFGLIGIWSLGSLYMVPSRAAWNTIFVPLIYVATSLSFGITFSLFVQSLFNSSKLNNSTFTLSSIVHIFTMFSIGGYVVFLTTIQSKHYSRSFERLISGDLSKYFWICVALFAFAILSAVLLRGKKRWVAIIVLTANIFAITAATFLIRASIYSMGTSVQQYIY